MQVFLGYTMLSGTPSPQPTPISVEFTYLTIATYLFRGGRFECESGYHLPSASQCSLPVQSSSLARLLTFSLFHNKGTLSTLLTLEALIGVKEPFTVCTWFFLNKGSKAAAIPGLRPRWRTYIHLPCTRRTASVITACTFLRAGTKGVVVHVET